MYGKLRISSSIGDSKTELPLLTDESQEFCVMFKGIMLYVNPYSMETIINQVMKDHMRKFDKESMDEVSVEIFFCNEDGDIIFDTVVDYDVELTMEDAYKFDTNKDNESLRDFYDAINNYIVDNVSSMKDYGQDDTYMLAEEEDVEEEGEVPPEEAATQK
jgi:hypothetical protein